MVRFHSWNISLGRMVSKGFRMILIYNKSNNEVSQILPNGFPKGYNHLLSCLDFSNGKYPTYCCLCGVSISENSSHPLGNDSNPRQTKKSQDTPDGVIYHTRCCDECDINEVIPKRLSRVSGKISKDKNHICPYTEYSVEEFIGWGEYGRVLRRDEVSDEEYKSYKERFHSNLKSIEDKVDLPYLLDWSQTLYLSVRDMIEGSITRDYGRKYKHNSTPPPRRNLTLINNRYFILKHPSFLRDGSIPTPKEIVRQL